MNKKFKLRLSFGSLVSIASLIGFCAGVLSIPINLFSMLSSGGFGTAGLWLLLVTPIAGIINGALLGVLGYPFYWWITKKVGFSYRGELYDID